MSDVEDHPESTEPSSPWQPPAPPESPAPDHGWSETPTEPTADADGSGSLSETPLEDIPPSTDRPYEHTWNPITRMTRRLPHWLRVTVDWIVTIVGAIAIVLFVKAYIVNPYRIPSSSMESTLHCAYPATGCEAERSDRVLANRFLYHLRDPRRGEIVVFNTPPEAVVKCGAGGTYVKRLIGLPGETIEVRVENNLGYVFINGKKLDEPYIENARRGSQPFPAYQIGQGQYFMMGDNRSASCDSRLWGTVPHANLIGKVFATYWPPLRISLH